MATALTLATKFTAVDKFSAVVSKMGTATSTFANKASVAFARVERAGRKLNKGIHNITGGLGNMAKIGSGILLAGGIAAGADSFLDLDKNISAASAKFGIFSRESDVFQAIRNKALEMGAATEFTSGQAASALKNLATAGFDSSQAISGLNTVLDLATATQSELSMSADVAAKSMAAFGLRSKDPLILAKNLGITSDVLNKLITTSGFGQLEEFLDVIAMSGSTARAAGVDIQTWGAIVAGSVSEAVPASVAGTRFANMLNFMTKNTQKFNSVGIKLKDIKTGNFRDIIDILADIDKQTKTMDKFDRAGLLLELFGERGSKMAASLLENGIPALRKYKQEIVDATGITQKMAAFMRSGVSGGLAAMRSGIDSIVIALGDAFQPEIDAAILAVTEIARGAKDWVTENKELIKTISNTALFLGKTLIAFKLFMGIIALVKGAIVAYNVVMGVMAVVTNSALWPILAVIAAITAAVLIMENWGAITDWVSSTIGKLIDAVKAFDFVDFFKSVGQSIIDFLLFPLKTVLALVSKIPGVIGEGAASALSSINDFTNITGNITADKPELLNPDATSERIRTERSEKTLNQRLAIDINDKAGVASISENTGVPVKLSKTFGWQQ